MAREYSDYQRKVIQRYYENRDQIDEQRLSELVTNLYLTQGKQRARYWQHARTIMQRLGVPEGRIEYVVGTDDPTILAEVVKDILAGRIRKKS